MPEFIVAIYPESAKTTVVVEAKLHSAAGIPGRIGDKIEKHQIMLLHRLRFFFPEEMPGHFEMPPERDVTGERDQDVFAAAGDIENLPAREKVSNDFDPNDWLTTVVALGARRVT
jgi:hypothetical protein